MPPKRGKVAGNKGKKSKEESITNSETNVASVNVDKDNAVDDTQAGNGHATEVEATADTRAEKQIESQPESQPEVPDEATPKQIEAEADGHSAEESGTEGQGPQVTPSQLKTDGEAELDINSEPTAKSSTSKQSKDEKALASRGNKEEAQVASSEPEHNRKDEAPESNKRKAAQNQTERPRKQPKVAREGERKSGRAARKTEATQDQILNYLLSDSAADLCRPHDEVEAMKERGSDLKTYSTSVLSPFEELLCAVVLSRPISHRLGLRTIRTILNDPYSFNTPKSIIDAGKEKARQALEDAHTQHKDKTTEQISLIAEVVTSKFSKDPSDSSLEKAREDGNKDWDDERDLLQASIKGLGKTGLDIFFRRIQWLWEESFPFIDERTARGVDKLGLPKNAEQLRKLLEENWSKLDTDKLAGDDKAAKIRRAFVIICERATGADLEQKSESLLEAAGSS